MSLYSAKRIEAQGGSREEAGSSHYGDGAAVAVGTDCPDTLAGGTGNDSVVGLEGEDFLAGDDSLAGGPGEDRVYGRSGDDSVPGGPGDDEISGTLGADAVSGDDGDDLVDDGPHRDAASDELSSGNGDDVIDAFNDPASTDVVFCGPGNDLAYTDGTDEVSDDCEEIVRDPHPDPWDVRFDAPR